MAEKIRPQEDCVFCGVNHATAACPELDDRRGVPEYEDRYGGGERTEEFLAGEPEHVDPHEVPDE